MYIAQTSSASATTCIGSKRSQIFCLLEREVDSVISSVETEVCKYELATNLAKSDADSDLDMDNDICDKGNDF